MRNTPSKFLTPAERWPIATLAMSDNIADRCKAASASYALSEGRKPHRTRPEYVRLALRVRP